MMWALPEEDLAGLFLSTDNHRRVSVPNRISLLQARIVNTVPEELLAIPRWAAWRRSNRRKMPEQASGATARVNRPEEWCSSTEALERYDPLRHEGVGILFASCDDVCGVDLDKCRDPQTGEISPEAQELIQLGSSYTEISPSGTGVKIFGRSSLQLWGTKTGRKFGQGGWIECYQDRRFFTVTGERLEGSAQHLHSLDQLLHHLQGKYGSSAPSEATAESNGNGSHRLCDVPEEFRLQLARQALASSPPCVQGQGGNSQLYRVIADLVIRHSLETDQAVALFMSDLNPRCLPPWEDESEPLRAAENALEDPAYAAEYGQSVSTAWMLQRLRERGGCIHQTQPQEPLPVVDQQEAFPVGCLPEPLRGFVLEGSRTLGCDPSYLALASLTVCAAAIGGSVRLQMTHSWRVPSILWGVLVGESGSSKSPAFKLAIQPLEELQRQLLQQHQEALARVEADRKAYRLRLKMWTALGDPDAPVPAEPVDPQMQQLIVKDTTVEAMTPLLAGNPRGVLLARDELSGWIGSFNKYSGGSSDESFWLSAFNGAGHSENRKSSGFVYLPQCCVSVLGGIQPGILHTALGTQHRESGMSSRMLLVMPSRQRRSWDRLLQDVEPRILAAYSQRVQDLLAYDIRPDLQLTPVAEQLWRPWFNAQAVEILSKTGEAAALHSKMEELPCRLALILQLVEEPGSLWVGERALERALELSNWFHQEHTRIRAYLWSQEALSEESDLYSLSEAHGGQLSCRQLMRLRKRYKTAQEATQALQLAGIPPLGSPPL